MENLKDEIKSTIEHFFEALDTQDLELMKKLIPEDDSMVHIGTDSDEIWRGSEELKRSTEEQFRRLEYYKAHIHDLAINFSQSEDVAWYFHLLDARILSGGSETVWKDARFTGVLEKRNGCWVLVQTHVSIPNNQQDEKLSRH